MKEGGAVRRVGNVDEAVGAGEGLGVAGVGEGVAEGVDLLKRAALVSVSDCRRGRQKR